MTLVENVELPMRFAEVDRGKRERLARRARKVGLRARMNHRPSGTFRWRTTAGCFGARFDQSPANFLADEPTGNLDSHTGTEIMNLVREFNQRLGMTVVMVTHERALAERYAKRMIFLADGKLVGDRTELVSRPGKGVRL